MLALQGSAVLFINGVEVPLIGANAVCVLNDFTNLTFQIPPTAKAFKIPYRSLIHLFVYDNYINDYVMLFEGEMTTRGYSFGGSSASISFGAKGVFHHFQQMSMSYSGIGLSNSNQSKLSFFSQGQSPVSSDATVSHLASILASMIGGENAVSTALMAMIADSFTNEYCYSPPFRNVVTAFYRGRGRLLNTIPGLGKGTSRYDIFDIGTIRTLYDLKNVEWLSGELMGQVNGRMSRWDILNKVRSFIFYDTVMPLGTLQKSYIMKPQLHYNIPPLCNVLLPSMISQFSFTDSMFAEPTRIQAMVNANPNIDKGAVSIDRYYPAELNEKLMEVAQAIADNKDPFEEKILEDGSKHKVIVETDKERKFGQMVAYAPLKQNFISATWAQIYQDKERDGSKANEKDFYNLIDKVLAAELYSQIASTKSGSYSGPFNPNIIPGFPALIIKGVHNPNDKKNMIAFIGYVVSVSHSISATGSLTTSASFTMVTQVEPNTKEYPEAERPAMPWYNSPEKDKLSDANIGAYYNRVLGCDSIMVKGDNVADAAANIYEEFIMKDMSDASGAESKLYSDQLISRYVATSKEFSTFYGASEFSTEPGEFWQREGTLSMGIINSGIFSAEAKQAVKDYMDELHKSQAFLGV